MQLNEISFYQLENLIMQRVPFKFLNFSDEQKLLSAFAHLNPYYMRFLKDQLYSVTTEEKALEFISSQSFPLDMPMVLLCEDGESSKSLAQKLEQTGFKNVYVIAAGLKQLLQDARLN